MDQDGMGRIALLVRLEVEQGVRHRPPNARRLVGRADVGGYDVPEDRLDGLGHVGVGDGGELVVHGRVPPRVLGEIGTAFLGSAMRASAGRLPTPTRRAYRLRSANIAA